MLCLKCGQREQFADNLCEKCLMESVKPFNVPDVSRGFICPSCGRVSFNGKSWHDADGEIGDAAVKVALNDLEEHRDIQVLNIDMSVNSFDKLVFQVGGKGRAVYKGVIINQDILTEVRLVRNLCDTCSKQHGSYFEAIIQLRGIGNLDNARIQDIVESITDDIYAAHVKDPAVFLSRSERVKGGWDFYLGEKNHARNLAQRLHEEYGGEFKVSSSLYGRKEGKEIYRYTFLVRLPGFLIGDILMLKGTPHIVEKISRKKVHLKDLENRSRVLIDVGDAMKANVLPRESVARQPVVIMETDEEIQVLHPETLRPVDLIKPPDLEWEGGERIECVLVDGEVYLV